MINENISIEHSLKEIHMRIELFSQIFDYSYEGIVVVDKNANIVYINRAALEIINLKDEDVINKNVKDIIPTSRLDIILKTQKSEIGWPQQVGNGLGMVHRFPIIHNNEIIGAIGFVIFKNMSTIEKMIKKFKLNLKDIKVDESYYNRIGATYSFENIIGESIALKETISKAKKAAKSPFNIMLIGETGVGKELFAHSIHSESHVNSFPLTTINCAAIPSQLLESELFGHEKGAFTGAINKKIGKFEIAGHGTIFLDEIGEMDIMLQSKLLRVLEEKKFERVGGINPIPLNARIISATNRTIPKLIKEDKFRLDLFQRLNTIEINIPSLKDREKDILLLFDYFAQNYDVGPLSPEAMNKLLSYNWPGNIRELENVVKRLSVFSEGNIVSSADLPLDFSNTSEECLDKDFNEEEKLKDAIDFFNGNKSKAAQYLGISRPTLYKLLRKHNIP